MKCFQHRRAFLVVATGAVALANSVKGLEIADLMAYSMGPVLLRPQASVAERYDDNVFYRSSVNQKGDFVSVFSPGMTVTLGRKELNNPWFDFKEADQENYLSVSYNLDRSYYATYSQLNGVDHTFQLSDRLKGYRLTLEGSDQIQLLNDVIGGAYGLGTTVKRTVSSDSYTLSYLLTQKSMVYARGSYNADDYAANTPLYDDNREAGTVGFDYRAFEKTSFFGEAYYGQATIHPNRPRDPDGPHEEFIGGFVGIRGQFTTRIKGSVKVGYESRSFSDHTPVGDSPVVEATLSYRFRERTLMYLSYIRSTAVSVQATSVSFGSDALTFRIDQRFGSAGKWLATLNANYLLYTFDPTGAYANRQDDWTTAGASVTYFFRLWLKANLAYVIERFNSNYANRGLIDYTANRVILKLTVGY